MAETTMRSAALYSGWQAESVKRLSNLVSSTSIRSGVTITVLL